MLAALLEWISNLWAPADPESQLAKDTRRRANRAYSAAWKARGGARADDVTPLVTEMRARNVPGSFVDDPDLNFYFDRWRTGLDPKAVRAESKVRRR
jgi:hypothetical protein